MAGGRSSRKSVRKILPHQLILFATCNRQTRGYSSSERFPLICTAKAPIRGNAPVDTMFNASAEEEII